MFIWVLLVIRLYLLIVVACSQAAFELPCQPTGQYKIKVNSLLSAKKKLRN